MANIIKVKIGEKTLYMEGEEAIGGERLGVQQVSAGDKLDEIPFEKLSDTIKTYCTELVKTFQAIEGRHIPDKISAEFGIKIGGEGGFFVAKASAEASLTISAEWSLKQNER